MKSKSISQLKKKLDSIFSLHIRKRDKGKCFTCGATKEIKEMQTGHFVSRSHNSVRYDEINCHCQCVGCNIFKNGNLAEYSYRLIQKYGQKEFNNLIKKGRQIKQFNIKELEDKINYYDSQKI